MEVNRRQFLIKTSSSIAAGLALYKGLRPSSAAAEEVNSIPWVTPVFLMTYPVAASDYRPVVNSTATGLIFERTISTELVITVLQKKGAAPNSNRGIASLDVSAFVA